MRTLIPLDLHIDRNTPPYTYKWLMQKLKRNNSELSVKPCMAIMTSPRTKEPNELIDPYTLALQLEYKVMTMLQLNHTLAIGVSSTHSLLPAYNTCMVLACMSMTGLLLGRELELDGLHESSVDLEAPGEHVGGHGRRRAEEGLGDGLRAGQLAVEGGEHRGGAAAIVPLVVDEPPGEDEDLAGADGARVEAVGGGDEADVEGALEDEDDLGGARVDVQRVHAPRRVVDARHRHAQRVDSRELLNVRRRHRGPHRVARVARGRQHVGEEVVRRHVLRPLARESVQPQCCKA